MYHALQVLRPWLISAAVLVGVAVAVLLGHSAVHRTLVRFSSRTANAIDNSFLRHSWRPLRTLLPLLAIVLALPAVPIPARVMLPLRHGVGLGVIAAAAWLAISLLYVLHDAAALKFRVDVRDNLAARRVLTQVTVLERIGTTIIVIVTASIMLMTFPQIRQLGTSLLASAGLAGLIVGLAARSTLANLLAGVQVALTEPIRLDDVVIVEGEWGRVEEIRTSFVVVKIWDQRRLIVPISYFIERPFQNWTRSSADLIGSVYLYVDYTAPLEPIRNELTRVLEKSTDLWDGKVGLLQVTDSKEHTIELRALMSAPDSGSAWDLRCRVREHLVTFMQRNFPECLPRMRAEVHQMERTSAMEGASVAQG